jgi:hypothetical protein
VIVNGKAVPESKNLPSGDFSSWGKRGVESMQVCAAASGKIKEI